MRNPEFTDRFTRRISYANLAWFFAKHPMRALWASEARLAEAGRQRPDRGNFDPSAGRPPFAQSKSFALWSGFKASVFEYRGGRYFACTLLLLFAAVVLALAQRRVLPPGIPEGVYALSAMLLLELIVCSLADALDAPRHFLLFYALSDVLLIALVCLALRGARTLAHRAGAPAARV
jgi:hypothetical protein